MKVKTLAIPIRTVDFSETSQIVSLFTRDHGFVEGIAKGAYREKSGFQGPFDLAVLYEVVLIGRRTSGLSLLTESAVVDGLRGLRRHRERYAAASHVLELLRAVATAWAPDRALFDLTAEALSGLALSTGDRLGAWLVRFDALALRILGLLAPIRSCVCCGRVWPGGNRPGFISSTAGGLVCRRCRASVPGAEQSLSGAVIRALSLLTDFGSSLEDVEADWTATGPAASAIISRLRNNLLEKEFVCLKKCRL